MQLPVHFWCFMAMWIIGFAPTWFISKFTGSKNSIFVCTVWSVLWPITWLVFIVLTIKDEVLSIINN